MRIPKAPPKSWKLTSKAWQDAIDRLWAASDSSERRPLQRLLGQETPFPEAAPDVIRLAKQKRQTDVMRHLQRRVWEVQFPEARLREGRGKFAANVVVLLARLATPYRPVPDGLDYEISEDSDGAIHLAPTSEHTGRYILARLQAHGFQTSELEGRIFLPATPKNKRLGSGAYLTLSPYLGL